MLANYGYTDGSGEYYITIDTDKCNGCGECVKVCPATVLEIITDDYDEFVAAVTDQERKKIKYSCAPCKPLGASPGGSPCVKACETEAISHTW
jgi:ferredoxin